MKILTVVGARPQFIKAAALSQVLRKKATEILVHTGQHFDESMSQVFFEEMQIPTPDYNLEIHSLNHGAMTGRMLEQLEEIIIKEIPDWVLVYGDTNSTLAGALAARKLNVKVAHVEAGLRSFDERMPEEINRVLTDRMSNLLFTPSKSSKDQLLSEGIPKERIRVVGDIMFDAVQHFKELVDPTEIPEPYLLLTLHRQENTDDSKRLSAWCAAINQLAERHKVVCPLHPRTAKALAEYNLELNCQVLPPQGYLKILALIKGSDLVLTDSGGLQKEAFYMGKKCVTLRQSTEWTELVDLGVNVLSEPEDLNEKVEALLKNKMPGRSYPYGKGDTARQIVSALMDVNS